MLKPKVGRLLISEPIFNDSVFLKSVILLTHYSNNESIGLILNHPTKLYLSHLIKNISLDFQIFLGGPVDNQSLYYIHTLGNIIPKSIKVTDDIYFGGEFNSVLKLINNGNISKNEIKFFVGYTGWGKNQLNSEIENDSWIVKNLASQDICMNKSNQQLWRNFIVEMGDKYSLWSNLPKDPSLN